MSGTERQTEIMSYPNQPERDQVCICRKTRLYAGWKENGEYFAGIEAPVAHQDDCPLFEDYSTGIYERDHSLDAVDSHVW